MLSAAGSSWASDPVANRSQATAVPLPMIRPMNDIEQQSLGCIVSAAATMAATYAVGPSEIIMLVVGGLIVPSSNSVLFASLMATMASMGCIGGATITPLVTRMWRETMEERPVSTPVTEIAPAPPEMQLAVNNQPSDSDYVFEQGMGCILAGGGSAAAASVIGASEVVMITAGGVLVPATSSALWISMIATLVAGTCSLGAVAAPSMLWAYQQQDSIGASLLQIAGLSADEGAAQSMNAPDGASVSGPAPPAISLVGGVR